MTTIDPATVTKLRELIAAATALPWCCCQLGHLECREIGEIGQIDLHSPTSPFARSESGDDAALIVASVNALPALLDQLDAQAAEIERLRAELTLYANGAQCRMEERDAARREREDYKRRLIEAEDSLAAQHRRAEKADARVVALERELAEARKLEAVCHCGVPLRDHETENHGAVEMEHPCPNADRVAELDELLRKHALRECAECMGTGSYLGDEDRNGPCDACGGTGRVLPGEVSAVLAKRDGGR